MSGTCQFSSNGVVAQVSSFQQIAANDIDSMVSALNENGPISVCLQVQDSFVNYGQVINF